jgi:hypothetical protein
MDFDDEELQSLHDELKMKWELNLKIHDVKWPKNREKRLELMCLYNFIGTPLTQDEMEIWIGERGGHYKRQARHHARDGWYIVSGNKKSHYYDRNLTREQLMLISASLPNPIKPITELSIQSHRAIYTSRLRLLRHNRKLSAPKRCEEWIRILEETELDLESKIWDTNTVSILLALCHPDEFEDQRGEYIGDSFQNPHSISKFKSKRKTGLTCQIGDIFPDSVCPWLDQGYVEKDHYWPHSLGGPTSSDNLLYLCKKCNIAKSSSPFYFSFDHIPPWLRSRIRTLSELKSRTWVE